MPRQSLRIALALTLLTAVASAEPAAPSVDVITAPESDEVTVRFQPRVGSEQRVLYRLDGDSAATFGAWTTERVEIVLPVREEATVDSFEVETRAARTKSPTIAVSGYIRIKKLNSGG